MGVQRETTQSLRWTLREATRDSHHALDRVAGSFDLQTLEGLRSFLDANAAAYAALVRYDHFFDGHIGRRLKLIEKDLSQIGGRAQGILPEFTAPTDATALGYRYVVAGSSLGGRMLARVQAGAKDKRVLLAGRFLADPELTTLWRGVLGQLDQVRVDTSAANEAVTGAHACFTLFANAFKAQTLVVAKP
ncbi:MAG: biliverdin-producing heme oxygenase [Pseudomonadota bacterium]